MGLYNPVDLFPLIRSKTQQLVVCAAPLPQQECNLLIAKFAVNEEFIQLLTIKLCSRIIATGRASSTSATQGDKCSAYAKFADVSLNDV